MISNFCWKINFTYSHHLHTIESKKQVPDSPYSFRMELLNLDYCAKPWINYMYFVLFVCLFVCIVCLSVCLNFCLSVCLFVYTSAISAMMSTKISIPVMKTFSLRYSLWSCNRTFVLFIGENPNAGIPTSRMYL